LGFIDSMASVGNWFQTRWKEDWKAFGDTYEQSWKEDFPKAFHQFWGGLTAMATTPFRDDAQFFDGARLWLDGSLGMGKSVLGGTLGGLFQAPVLNEATWLLDRAYRYGIARPISTIYTHIGSSALEAEAAAKRGEDPQASYLRSIFDINVFTDPDSQLRQSWNDTRNVTPGQAIVWAAGGLVGQVRPGNPEDPLNWSRAHDPRTIAGQQTFNSENSEFLLKYASGGIDFFSIVAGDPAYAAAKVIGAGKAKVFDRVATEDYVRKGGVEKEVSSARFDKFYETAKNDKLSPTPEALRVRTMPRATFGGQVSTVLWASARMSKDIFRDAYIVARGLDGAWDGSGVGAWDRLVQNAPRIASDFARLFANWNIGEDATVAVRGGKSDAIQSLVRNDAEAFVEGMLNREGLWGTLPGKLYGQAQPRAGLGFAMTAGVHSWAMDMAPTMVGRPLRNTGVRAQNALKRSVRTFMPSQGFTPFLDADDSTAITLRQIRANLERSGMPVDRIEWWVSQWGSKGSREGRNEAYWRAEEEAVKVVAARLGLDPATVEEALPQINRFREGSRLILPKQRVYISDFAARAGARHVAEGRVVEAKPLRDLNRALTPHERKGEFGDAYYLMTDIDGRPQWVPISDTGKVPSQGPATDKPVLLSQTESMIPTIDFRALEGQLRYWRMAHPEKQQPKTVGAAQGAGALALIGRAHQAWNATITASDFANMVWKASALLRPAQMPRNLADDVLRRYLVFGKLPVILGAMKGTQRAFQNAGRRGRMVHEEVAARRASRRASRTTTLEVAVPGAKSDKPKKGQEAADVYTGQGEGRSVLDVHEAWRLGFMDIDEYIHTLKWMLGEGPGYEHRVPQQLRDALFARDQKIEHPDALGKRDEAFAEQTKASQEGLFRTGESIDSRRAASDREFDRALRRRIVEFHYGDQPTVWLDDLRMKSLSRKRVRYYDKDTGRFYTPGDINPDTGRPYNRLSRMEQHDPLDPRYIEVPKGALTTRGHWLAELIAAHQQRYVPESPESVGKRPTQFDEYGEAVDAEPAATRGRAGAPGQAQIVDKEGRPIRVTSTRPAQMLVNPFTGKRPPGFESLDDYTIGKHLTIDLKAEVRGGQQTGRAQPAKPAKLIADFIADNIDAFIKPDSWLSMSIMPDGNVRIGVARPKGAPAARAPIPTGFFRQLRDFQFGRRKKKDILDAAHERVIVHLTDSDGKVRKVELKAPFEGPEGEAFQHRVSAQAGAGTWQYLVGDFNTSRILNQMGGWGIVRGYERGYAQSWERAVNAQIAGDPVARRFLEGWTDSDVLTWIESTPEGTAYLHRMHYFGVNYVDHVRQIEAMVDTYVPLGDTAAHKRLREAVLERKATVHDLDRVVADKWHRPEVHGASTQFILGKGAIFDYVSRGIDFAQKLLSDLPTDKASRYPFFAEAYRRHLTGLVRAADARMGGRGGGLGLADEADSQAGTRTPEQQAQVAKMLDSDVVSKKVLDNLERQARDMALHDTKYRLYDVAQINDLARLTRFVVPFSSAIVDSYIKYGRIIRDNPGTVLQGLYYWEMFERNDAVQDENGYVLRIGPDGEERWFAVNPDTGEKMQVQKRKGEDGEDHWYVTNPKDGKEQEVASVGRHRYVQFRLPSDIMNTTKYYGVPLEPVFAFNKKTFNVFLDLPSAGPVVAIPASEFALDNPEFGESKFIQQFVLPFGPNVSWSKIGMPANVRNAWQLFNEEDGNTAEGHAKAIFQAELIAYAREERAEPPSFAEVRERAAQMRWLRFWTSFASPASFQVQSPYQPYIDAYRQLRADPNMGENADEIFQTRHGDEFYALAMTVTRNNAGIRASVDSHKGYLQHKELITAYPELAPLIVGNAGGSFSKSVYEAQKEMPLRPGQQKRLREVMSLEDSVSAVERDRVWEEYTKLMDLITAAQVDRGLATLRGSRAADLAAMRDAFIEKNKMWTDPETGRQVFSPWYRDFSSVDHASVEQRIEQMWAIVQDPNLQQRDDIRGLIDYLHMREQMQEEMRARGLKTLDSVRARELREQWEQQSFGLQERYPAFAKLWARWLSRDDRLTLPRVVTQAA
jgi:hypothetical protein